PPERLCCIRVRHSFQIAQHYRQPLAFGEPREFFMHHCCEFRVRLFTGRSRNGIELRWLDCGHASRTLTKLEGSMNRDAMQPPADACGANLLRLANEREK